MQKTVEISVIMAAYNVEKYLERAIRSILDQKFKEFELIIIDDGSTDQTGEIAKALAKEDERIKVYQTANQGVSAARNFAIDKAKGKYIYFMDSDDYTDADMLSYLYKQLMKKEMDLVVFGFYFETWKGDSLIQQFPAKCKNKVYDNEEQIRKDFAYLWNCDIFYNVWNKIFVTDVIRKNNIHFEKMKFGEDLQFNIDYLYHCTSMITVEKCYYHYIRERQGAATYSYINSLFEIRKSEYKNMIKLFEHWNALGEAEEEYISRRYAERIVGCIENMFENGGPKRIKDKMKEIRKISNDESVQYCIRYARPHSKSIKCVLFLLKHKYTALLYLFGKTAFVVRRKFPAVFNKLKYTRQNNKKNKN